MAKCKYPNCGKELVGNEKYLCKSCKDKIKSKAKKTSGVAVAVLVIARKGGIEILKKIS